MHLAMMPFIRIIIPLITAAVEAIALIITLIIQDTQARAIMKMKTGNGGCFGKRNRLNWLTAIGKRRIGKMRCLIVEMD